MDITTNRFCGQKIKDVREGEGEGTRYRETDDNLIVTS